MATTYVVYRHGPGSRVTVVGSEEAANAGEAKRQMAARVRVRPGQHLSAKSVGRASMADCVKAWEAEQARAAAATGG